MNPHLLQLHMTPAEYRALMAESDTLSGADDSFWRHIPNYLIARCPICGATYTAQLNTYDPGGGWVYPVNGSAAFDERKQHIGCGHFVAVHHFINLYGDIPQDRSDDSFFELSCEVPHVQPVFLPDDIRSYAVMHALPICKIEEERFVPRYSLFLITYYSENRAELVKRRWRIVPEAHGVGLLIGAGYYLYEEREAWDLPYWVRAGKLWWLDAAESDLPLRSGPPEAFPYGGIQGRREERIVFRYGKRWPQPIWKNLWHWLRGEEG